MQKKIKNKKKIKMIDLERNIIALQNQKQTIATNYEEINNEITELSQSLALVFEEQQRVEKDIILLEIEQNLGDFYFLFINFLFLLL